MWKFIFIFIFQLVQSLSPHLYYDDSEFLSENVCSKCLCDDNIIDCSNKGLTSGFAIDRELWPSNLDRIEILNLQHNKIGRIVSFPPMPNIKRIDLSHNNIVEIDDDAFYDVANLTDLDLSFNQIRGKALLSSKIFQGRFVSGKLEPINIKYLNLSYNEISFLPGDIFEHTPYIERLSLRGSSFENFDRGTMAAIGSSFNLEVLDLSFSKITELPDYIFINLKNLSELNLADNLLTAVPHDTLKYIEHLEILYLNNNPIRTITAENGFPEMPNLIQLHISEMPRLRRIESGALSGLKNLQYLDCKMNDQLEFISGSALQINATWPPLLKLNLSDNALVNLDYNLVQHWEKLKHLDLRGNLWSCDCENQWILEMLMPLMAQMAGSVTEGLLCSSPLPMKGKSLKKLYEKGYKMRCRDYFGNHPEKDATILISIFVFVVFGLISGAVFFWLKKGRFRQGRVIDYTAIYQQSVNDDFKAMEIEKGGENH